jgi:hypothetical protein
MIAPDSLRYMAGKRSPFVTMTGRDVTESAELTGSMARDVRCMQYARL